MAARKVRALPSLNARGTRPYRSMRFRPSDISFEAEMLEYARRLSDTDRRLLLDRLEGSDPTPGSGPNKSGPAGSAAEESVENSEEGLLDAVEKLVERLEGGAFFKGWGWDPDIQDERAWGDESWAPKVDAALTRLDAAFFEGRRVVAAVGYGRVLSVFRHSDEAGIFCGPRPAQDMVKAELGDALARYLRAIYDTVPLEERVERLARALDELDGIGAPIGLQAMRDAAPEPMADFGLFLKKWTAALEAGVEDERARAHPFCWETRASQLLREARALAQGLGGLARLAREDGREQAARYRDWVAALLGLGRLDEALNAAREGWRRVEDAEDRADLAEVVAALASARGEDRLALEARRDAFRVAPSAARLLAYAGEGAPRERALRARMKKEQTEGKAQLSDELAALLTLLGGDLEGALERVEEAKVLGWSDPGHPGLSVTPFILIWCSGLSMPVRDTNLARFWTGLETRLAGPKRGGLARRIIARSGPAPAEAGGAGAFFEARLRAWRRIRGARLALLERLRGLVRRRTEAIVTKPYRGAYERACALIVALAEAQVLAHERAAARDWIEEWRRRFPRHRAFQRILSELIEGSAVMPGEA